jgi:hypothetical protein
MFLKFSLEKSIVNIWITIKKILQIESLPNKDKKVIIQALKNIRFNPSKIVSKKNINLRKAGIFFSNFHIIIVRLVPKNSKMRLLS